MYSNKIQDIIAMSPFSRTNLAVENFTLFLLLLSSAWQRALGIDLIPQVHNLSYRFEKENSYSIPWSGIQLGNPENQKNALPLSSLLS